MGKENAGQLDEYFLGDLVSYEQGDCSVVASNTNKAVRAFIGSEYNLEWHNSLIQKRDIYNVSTSDPTESTRADTLAMSQHVTVGEDEITLQVIRPYLKIGQEELVPVTEAQIKSRFLGLGKKTVEQVVVGQRPAINWTWEALAPQLVAMFGEDLYLPLASFEYRDAAGACSFIQLGQEMYDKNYYVTPADERGPRHKLVTAIKEVIDAPQCRNFYAKGTEEYSLLAQFVAQEKDRFDDEWQQKKEAQLVRRCAEKIPNEPNKNLMIINEADGIAEPSKVAATPLAPFALLPSGRRVQFMLTREEGQDNILLTAVTRGNVALPLIEMSPGAVSIDLLSQQAELDADQRPRLINDLFELLGTKVTPIQLKDYLKDEDIEGPLSDEASLNYALSEVLYEQGLLAEGEKKGGEAGKYCLEERNYECGTSIWYELSKEGIKARNVVHEYLKDFLTKPMPFSNTFLMQLAAFRLRKGHERLGQYGKLLNLDQRLDEVLGSTTTSQEDLLEKILHFAKYQRSRARLLREVPFRTGSRGDIMMQASASLENTGGSLTISGLPDGQPEANRSVYIPLKFDIMRPLFAAHNLGETDPDIYAANVDNLLNRILLED